jgi:hypothetical protein
MFSVAALAGRCRMMLRKFVQDLKYLLTTFCCDGEVLGVAWGTRMARWGYFIRLVLYNGSVSLGMAAVQ